MTSFLVSLTAQIETATEFRKYIILHAEGHKTVSRTPQWPLFLFCSSPPSLFLPYLLPVSIPRFPQLSKIPHYFSEIPLQTPPLIFNSQFLFRFESREWLILLQLRVIGFSVSHALWSGDGQFSFELWCCCASNLRILQGGFEVNFGEDVESVWGLQSEDWLRLQSCVDRRFGRRQNPTPCAIFPEWI